MASSKKKVTPEVEPVVIPKFSIAALEKMLETMTEPEFLKYTEKGNSPRNIPHLDLLYASKVDKVTTGPKAFIATEYMFGRKIYLQRSGENLDPLYVCWKVTHKKHHRYKASHCVFGNPDVDYPARTDLNELSDFEMYERLPYGTYGKEMKGKYLLTGGVAAFKKIEKENPKLATEVIEHCLSQITVDNFIEGNDLEPRLPYLRIEKFHTKEYIPGDSTTTEYTFAEDTNNTGNLKAGYFDTIPCWVVTYKKHENPLFSQSKEDIDRSHLNELSDFYRCERRREEGDKYPTYHKISKL